MSKHSFLTLFFLATLLSFGQLATAQDFGKPKPASEKMSARARFLQEQQAFVKKLGLSIEQKEQYDVLMEKRNAAYTALNSISNQKGVVAKVQDPNQIMETFNQGLEAILTDKQRSLLSSEVEKPASPE